MIRSLWVALLVQFAEAEWRVNTSAELRIENMMCKSFNKVVFRIAEQ